MQNLRENKACSVDDKGRFRLPGSLVNQLGQEHSKFFVLQEERSIPCLTLYPLYAWEERVKKYKKVNTEIPKFRTLVAIALGGASDVVLDGSGRVQIPRHLLEKYKLEDKVLVNAYENYIELWNEEEYPKYRGSEAGYEGFDFEAVSQEAFANL
jgi:MraZ protein